MMLGPSSCRRLAQQCCSTNRNSETFYKAAACFSTNSSPQPMELAWETVGEEGSSPQIVFLHGLLGKGRNLRTFAKQVCQVKDCSGILMDLRGHGQSRLSSTDKVITPPSFSNCVQDIQYTLDQQSMAPTTWAGHSWGGRMALQYAAELVQTQGSSAPVERVWILDSVPGKANESVERVVGTVAELQGKPPIGNRKELVAHLLDHYKVDKGTATWLASSYNAKTGDFGFDPEVVHAILPEFGTQDFEGYMKVLLDANVRVDVVRGGKNKGWDVPLLRRLETLQKEYQELFGLHVLPKAGHWVHVDDLPGLVGFFEKF
eukprot:Nitzschia sp. Nitz4//scaffold292_size23309//6512//7625//NITZ4_008496-RA/size23309-augustus-gene-0.5-mRNA-1//-1//CDS//3329546167//6041//frame0